MLNGEKCRSIIADSEIVPLTSIRGLAALWVVAFHFGLNAERLGYVELPQSLRSVIIGGSFAVDIFFLLSGYILMASYGLAVEPKKFFIHRVARIFPLHLVVLSAMVAAVAAMSILGVRSDDPEYFSWSALPYHFTLTFVWLGMPLGWNGPTWSLSAELTAYLIFPALQLMARYIRPRSVIAFTAVFLIADFAWLATNPADTGFGALGRALLGLSSGAALRLATYEWVAPSWLGATCAAAIPILAILHLLPFAVFPAALLLVALAGNGNSALQRVMSLGPLKWAGDVSYSIFLIHAPLAIALFLLARRFSFLHSGVGFTCLLVAYIVVLAGASHCTWRFIERPARKVIRRLSESDVLVRSN